MLDLFSIYSTMALCCCLHSNETREVSLYRFSLLPLLLHGQGGTSGTRSVVPLHKAVSAIEKTINVPPSSHSAETVLDSFLDFLLIELLFLYFLLHFMSGIK